MVGGTLLRWNTRDRVSWAYPLRFIGWARPQPKVITYAWAILLPCHETDPANNVLLNMVCNARLYQSIWSLVGNHQERVGLRHVCTPLCVVITIVCFARSREIIQWAAKVWGSMGAVLRKQICPLGLVSMLDIWTWDARTSLKFSSLVTSAWSVVREESKFITKWLTCPINSHVVITTCPE